MSDSPDIGPFWDPINGPPVVDPAAVRPEVDDVGVLENTRTIDRDTGIESGTFTASTRPTDTQVQALIDDASADVLAQLPPNIDPIWYPAVTRAIALRAATMLEAAYYREAVMTAGEGAGAQLAQFTADLTALQSLVPKATYIA
jgi:hypothetical protein